MNKNLLLLATVATIGIAGIAPAQEASQAPDAQTEAEAPGADVSVLDTGEPVAEDGAGETQETYIRSTHGDWAIQCLPVQEGPEPCQMYQLLKDENGGNVANVAIVPALAPDQRVVVGMSLTGFTAAFEEITALEQPGQQ